MAHWKRAGVCVAACVAGLPVSFASADDLPALRSHEVPLSIDSSEVPAHEHLAEPQVLYSTVVQVDGAAWLRLTFGPVHLAGDPAANGAFVRITSMTDGAVQYLDAEALEQWGYTSAYFNGNSIAVDLLSYPSSGASRMKIKAVTAGEPVTPRSICGGVDDRVQSNMAASARLLPAGCTGWLFNDLNHTFLSAGHCNVTGSSVLEFNVPLSNEDGSIRFATPENQYHVEPTSIQFRSGGLGNDWAYFGAFPNSNTGLTPFQRQNAAYSLAPAAPATTTQQIRITGYGTTSAPAPLTLNQVQKTHDGPYDALAGTIIRYSVDTTGGNSGSPVQLATTGQVIGIHTNAGCNTSGGLNQGTAIQTSLLRTALADPRGICRSGRAAATGRVYIVGDLNNNFGSIATESGSFGLVSQLGPAMQGLAYDQVNDRLIAIDTALRLSFINPSTGALTVRGTVVGTTQTLNGLAFDPLTGLLYAIAQATGQLYLVNTTTLVAVPVGAPHGNSVGGIDFDTVDRVIYGVDDTAGGTRLVRIDRLTGAHTVVGALGAGILDCNGLAYDADTRMLFTVNANTDVLLQVNPGTGAATTVGLTNGLFGSTFGMAARFLRVTCDGDIDGDGDTGTDADIETFFAILGGGPGNPDFDGDGDSGTDADIEAFFRVLAGGPCRL